MMRSREIVAPGFGVDVGADRSSRRRTANRLSRRALLLVRERLFYGATLMAGLTLGNCALWLLVHPTLRTAPALLDVSGLVALALALDVSVLLVCRGRQLDDDALASFGLLYHLVRTFAVALYSVRLEVLLGWEPSPVTFASVTIATFPLLVPTPPLKTLGVSLLAGSAPPLVLWLHGATPALLGQGIFFAAVSVGLAVFCGQVAYGLSAAVARSDELGAYRLIEPLARGSAGALWRAEHRLLARPSAVKVIRPPWLIGRRFFRHLERFQREAQVATRLTSPHSVTVYDHGIGDDGSLFYARELLDGETLEQRVCREGPLPALAVVRIALQVCDSLGEAHQLGLVHRRLSPRQIFLCRVGGHDDFVKVLDFGLLDLQQRLALEAFPGRRGREERHRETGDCLAPETRERGIADEASDQFQLGCVLHFLLTGEHGAPAAEEALLRGAQPRELEQILRRCVAPVPAQRFASVDELAAALLDLLQVHVPGPSSRAHGNLARDTSSDRASSDRVSSDGWGLEVPHSDSGSAPSSLGSTVGDAHPRRESRARSEASGVMNVARHRLERFGILLGVATSLAFPLLAGSVDPFGPWALMELAALLGVSLAVDVALVLTSRRRSIRSEAIARLAVGYFVLRAWLLSFTAVVAGELLGTGPAPMSFGLVLLVMLPFLVALGPGRILLAALIGAIAHPLSLLMSTPPMAMGQLLTGMIDGATVVGGAYACARLVQAMRRSAHRGTYGVYRLTQLLAKGAMGEVWRAEHDLLARPAAIKLIAAGKRGRRGPRAAGARALGARFEREAQVTARLTSPHTVTLYDYGVSEDGTYYYVMELLQGEDLQRFVEARGPMPWQEALLVALQICDSLVEAHALGLVHRDLKPANVFLARIGRDPRFVKVLDFGLAELETHMRREHGANGRHPLRVAGTPGYLPPETLLELGGDARSDLYQLGCVIYFLMSGRLVFERSSVTALAVAHVREKPRPVSEAAGRSIPEEIERIVARCLAKSPEDRFASADELRSALRAVLARLGPAWFDAGAVSPDILPLVFKSSPQAWSASRTL